MTSPSKIDRIAIDDIAFEGRLRPADPAQIELLTQSIHRVGLQQPVTLRRVIGGDKPFQLVSGLQRVEAMRALGHDRIDAIIRQMSRDEARIVEIDENLMRRDLPALDKAALIASRLHHWEAVHGHSHGGDRKSAAARKSKSHRETLINSNKNNKLETVGDASRLDAALKSVSGDVSASFSQATADQVGLSRTTIFRLLSIYKRINPEVRADLRAGAPPKFTNNINQLYRLSREAGPLQRQIVDMIINGKAGNVAAAIRLLSGASQARKPDRMTAAINALLALPDHDLRALMRHVADTIKARIGIRITEAGND